MVQSERFQTRTASESVAAFPLDLVQIPTELTSSPITFSSIISALTFAIDLTEGAVPGHALRSCILGMRLAYALRVPRTSLPNLYYALLLKDVGCSSNAARMCEIVGGDDRIVKNGAKLEDWTRPHRPSMHGLKLLWQQVLPASGPISRLGRILKIAATQHQNNAVMIGLRCERGASIVRKLGLSVETSDAVYALDEHWDGSGYPHRLKAEEIPLFARIAAVAQHLDVFASERNCQVALDELRARGFRWFDPEIVAAAERLHEDDMLWSGCRPSDDKNSIRELALSLEPYSPGRVEADDIDRICEAFADVVDAKSPFTYRHSLGVAEVAAALAEALHLSPKRAQTVRRAALLHDLGKLGIPNTILDKRGQLNGDEWLMVMEHPRLTEQILGRIEPFLEIASIAGAHHEKLDGSGYPYQLQAHQIGLEARIVAVADCYQALTEQRPYRKASNHEEAMKILLRATPDKLDLRCVEALRYMRLPHLEAVPPEAGKAALAGSTVSLRSA